MTVQSAEVTPGNRRTWLQSTPAAVSSSQMRSPVASSPRRENSTAHAPNRAAAAAALAAIP
jgi:hypothetical protein